MYSKACLSDDFHSFISNTNFIEIVCYLIRNPECAWPVCCSILSWRHLTACWQSAGCDFHINSQFAFAFHFHSCYCSPLFTLTYCPKFLFIYRYKFENRKESDFKTEVMYISKQSNLLIRTEFVITLTETKSPEAQDTIDTESITVGYYIGGFKEYKQRYLPWGKGVCSFANGDFYEGHFKKGKPNGNGRSIAKGTYLHPYLAKIISTVVL